MADELLNVIAMLNNDEFVAEIIHTPDQGPPVLISYSDQQFTDLKFFLTNESDVVGIDRTFNMVQHEEVLCYYTSIQEPERLQESLQFCWVQCFYTGMGLRERMTNCLVI